MSCWNGEINYPDLTQEQNEYLKEVRDGFTANGCKLTNEQINFLDNILQDFMVVTDDGIFSLDLVVDEEGTVKPFELRVD